VRLRRCPLLEAARQEPEVVCSVHLGVLEGALEALGSLCVRPTLVPFAEPGACRLTLLEVEAS
jgi:predicted ArsR family transcriptional regulator